MAANADLFATDCFRLIAGNTLALYCRLADVNESNWEREYVTLPSGVQISAKVKQLGKGANGETTLATLTSTVYDQIALPGLFSLKTNESTANWSLTTPLFCDILFILGGMVWNTCRLKIYVVKEITQ